MDDDIESSPSQSPRRWWFQVRQAWDNLYTTNSLVRHLVNEPLFLAAILSFVAAIVGIGVLLPKRWDPTPPGFSKRIRVSLLDYLQAWSFRHSGRRAVRAGHWDDAIAKYRGAVANNLADTNAIRELLVTLRDSPTSHPDNIPLIFATTELLLELSHTSRLDIALFADVLEKHRASSLALVQLRPFTNDFTAYENQVWTRALLTAGQIQAFQERWDAQAGTLQTNELLRLYRAAADAGWGTIEQSVSGLDTLRSHLDQTNSVLGVTAARLLAAAALGREDLPTYETALRHLQQAESTVAQDHTRWWEMLARNGRKEEAVALAKAHQPVPPPTVPEFVQLARTWLALGLSDHAVAALRDHAGRFGQSMEVWATYFDLLMIRGEWNEVRRVAASLRANTTMRDALVPVALYADIRADLAENRRTAVKDSIRRLREAPLPEPVLGLRFAAGLNAAGEFDTAWHFLSQLENQLRDVSEYWVESVISARGRGDLAAMRTAADRLAALEPGNASAQTIRLVTLLGTRELPGEALAISLRLVAGRNRSQSHLINHAMALLLNQRAGEALAILEPLSNDSRLSEDERNSLNIALADAYAQLDRPGDAVRVGSKADATVLLQPQAEWFHNLMSECRRKSASAEPHP